jgi:hypothetical protein
MLVLQVSVHHDAGATSQCTSWCWYYWSVHSMLVLQVSVQYAGATGQCTSWCWCYKSVYIMMLVLLVSAQYAGATGQCTVYWCYKSVYIMMLVLLVSVHSICASNSVNMMMLVLLVSVHNTCASNSVNIMMLVLVISVPITGKPTLAFCNYRLNIHKTEISRNVMDMMYKVLPEGPWILSCMYYFWRVWDYRQPLCITSFSGFHNCTRKCKKFQSLTACASLYTKLIFET